MLKLKFIKMRDWLCDCRPLPAPESREWVVCNVQQPSGPVCVVRYGSMPPFAPEDMRSSNFIKERVKRK